MPSAARQRLPADLWRQGQRKHSSGSQSPIYHSQEIQASPGQSDVFQEDKVNSRQSKKNAHKSYKKQFHATGRGSPKSLPRRGSAETLNLGSSDFDYSSDTSSTAALSRSAKSDSCLSHNPAESCDAYAMKAITAPHPSLVPLPPLEWLQTSKRSVSPAISCMSLHALLGCQVAA